MTNLDDSYREIILDGVPIPLASPLSDNNLATVQRRLVLGDPGLDGNWLLSALVMADFSGGSGVEEINESTDLNRYLISSLYTRYPKMISKPYKVEDAMVSSTANLNWRYLGDLKLAGVWTAIVTGGTGANLGEIVYSLPYGGSPTSEGTLTNPPVNSSTRFRGTGTFDKLFIPMGVDGYATVEADTGFPFANVAADATHPKLIHSIVWDRRLIGIDTDGVLWYTIDGASWLEFGATAVLPTSEVPKKLIPYFDRQGQPAPFILTDTSLKQFDPGGPNIFEIDVDVPVHPYAGMAGTRYNGDLYFSVGMKRYTGGSLSPAGLDRDSGLPADYLGYISDLVSGNNGLYAAVANIDGNTSIHERSDPGWHMIWSSVSDIVPYSMGISRAGDKYSLMWGKSDPLGGEQGVYRMDLPVHDANPRNMANILSSSFSDAGGFSLYTGIYDMSMRGSTKVAAALDVTVEQMDPSASLTVYYRTSGFANTDQYFDEAKLLGTITSTGSHHLQFGEQNAHGIYPGIPFEKIQFAFVLIDSTDEPFIMESAVLAFIKTLPPSNSWTAQVDMSKPHVDSPDTIWDHIKRIMDNRLFVSMVFRGQTYRVMISQSSGTAETGLDERGARTISILEIPDGLDIL
jgi:hypothetical protein